jgi:hypothetical protein
MCCTNVNEIYKTNYIKYISSKLFYPYELQIKSCDNLADLFRKSLSLVTFDKCVKDIDMQKLKDLHGSGRDSV